MQTPNAKLLEMLRDEFFSFPQKICMEKAYRVLLEMLTTGAGKSINR
jgi:hypothetical protein